MRILGWLRPRKLVTARIRGVREPTLYVETSDATEVAELRRAFAVDAGTGAICICAGTLHIEIGDEPPLTLHHGESLRWSGSHGNQPLRGPDAAIVLDTFYFGPQNGFTAEQWSSLRDPLPTSALPRVDNVLFA
jgi:hypothetical protein